MKKLDLTGQTFGRLVVQHRVDNQNGRTYWACLCDCGNIKDVQTKYLRKNGTRSCGCYQRDFTIDRSTTHNMSRTKLYQQWAGMIARCEYESHNHYESYGGRGIKVCVRWRNNFENFASDMGERPSPKHSIDRIDTDGDYEPSNCCWSTDIEQSRNRRVHKRNKIGVPGVYKHPNMNRYCANIGVRYKKIHLGSFNTKDEAVQARKDAELKYWGKESS